MESPTIEIYRDPLEAQRLARSGFLFRILSGGRREMLFWSLNALFWAAIGLLGWLMTLAFRSTMPDVGEALGIRVATGFVLTAGLRWIYRETRLGQQRGVMKLALMAGCCLAAGLLEVLVMKSLMVGGLAIPGGAETVSTGLVLVRIFVVAVWSSLYFAVHLFEDEHVLELRAVRAELAARENELRHLQAQMNPHFLFNSLNAVLACKDDPDAVKDVTRSLAEYLRFLLQETRPLEPLSRELDAIEKFLTVQTSRFKGNLVCRIQWDPAARPVLVPPMIVQPLLENAFHYRSQNDELPLQIWLTARVEDGFLRVTASNNGDWVPPYDNHPQGTGIHALRQRLHLLLGPHARVEQQSDNGWLSVTIHIPLPAKSPETSREAVAMANGPSTSRPLAREEREPSPAGM